MALYGYALYGGVGIPEDTIRGEQLLEQSKHSVARAMCFLYYVGQRRDTQEGYRLLTTECDTSDPHVQYLLGECLRIGCGCTEDEAEAIRCFERAGNHVEALHWRGVAFLS
eukprot:TRINITY_DN6357_c0_g1_i1.p1 TRINITY_DN6357_c0_g1~~TRINITY_DN6357_c0_g1_i1.p1  ORF type:complete len:123 (-),score=30.98 TRINITY_DN6357_c0_g1_i1:24-356(-)